MFDIAAVSLPGGHKIVRTGVKFKSCFKVVKKHTAGSSCYTDSEKVQFDISTTYRFVVTEEKVKGQDFGPTGVKHVKILQFCWQWSQNSHQVKIKLRIVWLCEMLRYYGYAAKKVNAMVSQWILTCSLHNHGNETCHTFQTVLNLNCINKTSNWSILTCLTPVEPKS